MCLLIVLRAYHDDYPVLVAANRDERRDRKFSPPGLWVGDNHHRVLSPRDRKYGGTWLGVNEEGLFAGLTNVAGATPVTGAPTRGALPHLALGQGSIDEAAAALRGARAGNNAFQLVLADRDHIRICLWDGNDWSEEDWSEDHLVVSNEHQAGHLTLDGLHRVLGPVRDANHRLDLLRPLLLDRGGMGRHAVLKKGDEYGTVSSSLIGVPADDMTDLIWRFAPGPPDETEYRDYGNLGRRLVSPT